MAKNKQALGVAGEYLALIKLIELGYIVAPTYKNTANVDILVSNNKAAKMVQVKLTENSKNDWVCNMPKTPSKNLIYIFIKLNTRTTQIPEYYIIPSLKVKSILEKLYSEHHKQYREKHGKEFNADGNQKGVSKFNDTYTSLEQYKENWSLLFKDT